MSRKGCAGDCDQKAKMVTSMYITSRVPRNRVIVRSTNNMVRIKKVTAKAITT